MKKNFVTCLLGMLAITLGIQEVNAKCTYADKAALNNEVANVKVRYEAEKETIEEEENIECGDENDCQPYRNFININVLNLSPNFYINVKNSVTGKNQKYYYSDVPEDGILKIEWDDVTQINTFTVTVYASEETTCADEKLKVTHVTTPRINEYANYAICEEIPDYYLCKEYVTYNEDPTYGEFITKVENEIETRKNERNKEEKKGFFDKIFEFIKKYKVAIIVGTAVIIVLTAGTIIIIRKKKEL